MKPKNSYQLECDWTINHNCNFNCTYCIGVKNKTNKYYSPKKIYNAFNDLGKKCLIHITGGEPFLYPNFISICKLLTRKHLISINTNLSIPLDNFGNIESSKIYYFHISLHYDQRKKQDKNFQLFISNLKILERKKINYFISQVVAPHELKKFQKIYNFFQKYKITIHPKYNKNYRFDNKTTNKFIELAHRADQSDNNYEGKYSIDLSSASQRKQLSTKSFAHNFCSSGKNFITLNPDLSATKCLKLPLGSLLKKNLKLFKTDQICNIREPYCKSFCLKYSYGKKA